MNELPWRCHCKHEQMVDMDRLESWPLDNLTTARGYTCEKCGKREAISYSTTSLREALDRLMQMRPTHRKFPYYFTTCRHDVSHLEDVIKNRETLFCVACDKPFKIVTKKPAAKRRRTTREVAAPKQNCPRCYGSGWYAPNMNSPYRTCEVCKGTGKF